jgi:3-methyl-2-oxobutanoate hydroxymethyltransferase
MNTSPTKLFAQAKARSEKLAMISLYDAPSAALSADAGADILLVGDSMGNAILGHDGTVPVTMEAIIHHTGAVVRGVKKSSRPGVPVVSDLSFGGFATVERAVENASSLMRVGAGAIKLEGAGESALAATRTLVEMGVPVMGHLGYTPQSAGRFEGVVQGKTTEAASKLLDDAKMLEEAGCFAVVLEVVPSEVASRVTEELSISTVGIGAGPHCDAQVLVWHDLVGFSEKKQFRFVKRYADVHASMKDASESFVEEVRSGAFPAPEHGWNMSEDELRRWENGE